MRTFILGAVSALAVLAPVAAHADTPGFVDVSIGQTSFDDYPLDETVLSIGGSADVGLSPAWRAQFDVDTNRASTDDDDFSFTTTNVAAHVYYTGDGYSVGGVLTSQDLIFATIWSAGVEGQVNLGGQVVLEGELGFGTVEGFGQSESTTNAALDATFYATENLSLGVGVSTIDAGEVFDDEDAVTWRAEGEYLFTGTPISAFVNYSNLDIEDFGSDSWRVGLRYNFGGDTLQTRRQNGPRWLRSTPFNFLPIT